MLGPLIKLQEPDPIVGIFAVNVVEVLVQMVWNTPALAGDGF